MTMTSRLSYEEALPRITGKRWAVYEEIRKSSGITVDEISDRLHWKINQVTSRVSELADMGFIKDVGVRAFEGERKQTIWMISNENEHGYLVNSRLIGKGKTAEVRSIVQFNDACYLIIKLPENARAYKEGEMVRLA